MGELQEEVFSTAWFFLADKVKKSHSLFSQMLLLELGACGWLAWWVEPLLFHIA
jgi:hypothetical protein